jgi:hypothetical protein
MFHAAWYTAPAPDDTSSGRYCITNRGIEQLPLPAEQGCRSAVTAGSALRQAEHEPRWFHLAAFESRWYNRWAEKTLSGMSCLEGDYLWLL